MNCVTKNRVGVYASRRVGVQTQRRIDAQTQRRQYGFTLIEAVLTIVIISVGLFAMMLLFDNVTRGAMEGDMNITATYLARERLERIVFDKVYKGYDNILNSKYPTSENVVVGNSNYTRELNIYEAAKSDLTALQNGSNFKRIDVTVKWGTGATQRITETTLLTKY